MTRGQIVFYALLALIALIQALGLSTWILVVHLCFITACVLTAKLWFKIMRAVWDISERKSQKAFLVWFGGGFGLIYPLTIYWWIYGSVLEAVRQWVQAQ